jgi:hypothetical protein
MRLQRTTITLSFRKWWNDEREAEAMCMMCEEEFMYQAYLNYLARKAAEGGEAITAEEKAFLEASGFSCDPVPKASGFACDPVPSSETAEAGKPKAS